MISAKHMNYIGIDEESPKYPYIFSVTAKCEDGVFYGLINSRKGIWVTYINIRMHLKKKKKKLSGNINLKKKIGAEFFFLFLKNQRSSLIISSKLQ
jgi:hypothetical protein